jgi:ribonuclease D
VSSADPAGAGDAGTGNPDGAGDGQTITGARDTVGEAPEAHAPAEPAPSEPAPSEPALSEPALSEPALSEPALAGSAPPEPVPLVRPRDGTPAPLVDRADLEHLAAALAAGDGPVALDAERASGYRYGARAFLVQLRRADVGTALIDPVPLPDLSVLDGPLSGAEWVLHAANQDLACLAALGIRPRTLFDTELAARLAGLPRVGLGPLVEAVLGLHLAKGHGADDWSRRPLPATWLDYAALDVEVLIELRDAMADLLRRQGKWEWARQEFAAIVAAPPPAPRLDPWRRTSGIHQISDRRTLAAVRELWTARDGLARRRDLAPHRVLPDSAVVAAAKAMPATAEALAALPVFSGPAQRRQSALWLAAIQRARDLPASDLPPARLPSEGPPAPSRWSAKDPAAAARLAAARTGLAELSERLAIPVENLMTPDLVRRVLWRPPTTSELPARLAAGGARPWQIDLVAPILVASLTAAA